MPLRPRAAAPSGSAGLGRPSHQYCRAPRRLIRSAVDRTWSRRLGASGPGRSGRSAGPRLPSRQGEAGDGDRAAVGDRALSRFSDRVAAGPDIGRMQPILAAVAGVSSSLADIDRKPLPGTTAGGRREPRPGHSAALGRWPPRSSARTAAAGPALSTSSAPGRAAPRGDVAIGVDHHDVGRGGRGRHRLAVAPGRGTGPDPAALDGGLRSVDRTSPPFAPMSGSPGRAIAGSLPSLGCASASCLLAMVGLPVALDTDDGRYRPIVGTACPADTCRSAPWRWRERARCRGRERWSRRRPRWIFPGGTAPTRSASSVPRPLMGDRRTGRDQLRRESSRIDRLEINYDHR
jgi:hypothetical protein